MAASLKQAGGAARIPSAASASLDEVAQAVLMAVGNAFMTGQTIAVNGGVLFT